MERLEVPVVPVDVLDLPVQGWGNFLKAVRSKWEEKVKEATVKELIDLRDELKGRIKEVVEDRNRLLEDREALYKLKEDPRAIMDVVVAWNGGGSALQEVLEDYLWFFRHIKRKIKAVEKEITRKNRTDAYYSTILGEVEKELRRREEE